MIDPVFHDSRVTLYCGDSRELLPKVEERHGRIVHVMTDPPYSERTHKNARTLKGGDGPKKLIEFASTTFEMIRDIFTLANAERWTISFTDNVHAALLEVMPPEGMRHMRTGMWEKPDGSPQLTGDRPAQAHECIVALHPMTASRWNSGGKRGVWTHGVERDIPWHNTPKPVSLCRELITDFTDEEDLIVDPFGGSGAFGVAGRWEKRRVVLIELDPAVCQLTAQRLRDGRARPVTAVSDKVSKKHKNQIRFDF